MVIQAHIKSSWNISILHQCFNIVIHHCCYQGDFQEINILMNRALLPNCKIESTACPFLKNSFKKLSFWWFWCFLVIFGDFWWFLALFFSNLALILLMPHRKVSWHQQKSFTWVIFTPVGNFGPYFWHKYWPNKKTFFGDYAPGYFW